MFADFQAQQIHIRAMKEILGPEFNPLHILPGRNEEGKSVFTKNVDVPENHLSIAYLLHAYDVNASTFKRLRQRNGKSLVKQVPHNKGQSVLDNADYAKTQYTPLFFYVQKKMKLWVKQNPQASVHRKAMQRKNFRALWETEKSKDAKFGAAYEKKSRDHVVRQTGAKDEIVETLNSNGRRSYTSLE